MSTKDEEVISTYNKVLIEIKNKRNEELERLKELKSEATIELTIAIRVWHRMEEEFIRYKLEHIINSIDFLVSLDFNFHNN